MKIQLSSTLPFNPIQLKPSLEEPVRTVGLLHGVDNGREYRTVVYQFRHADDGAVDYLVDPLSRLYLDELEGGALTALENNALPSSLTWVPHEEGQTYKPYSYLVMNAMASLSKNWDGLVYRKPVDRKPIGNALNSTLQIIDSCVCQQFSLWVKVHWSCCKTEAVDSAPAQLAGSGWVPVT